MTGSEPGRVYHIIGVGGIGMSAIAEVMHARGFRVQGSDLKDGANLRRLAEKGLDVVAGHRPRNLGSATDVVISTAVKAGNPELEEARARGLRVHKRADMLAEIMKSYRTVSITGSHGKTTTTSMTAWIFEHAGYDPTALVGGVIGAWGSNVRIGRSPWMVVEADESDGTFIRLPTEIGVVTNIDPEHLDYYGSEEKLHDAFRAFFSGISHHGAIIAGVDHPVVARMIAEARETGGAAITTFGECEAADIRVRPVSVRCGNITIDVEISVRAGGPRRLSGVTLQVPGRHNTLNAAAAIGAALRAGIEDDVIVRALRSFTGVDRRFTQTGDWNGVSIYDDYAHHPAEIEAVLSAARGAASGNVIAVMQPHRFSRLKMLFDDFCGCFANADFVLVAPVYPAGEAPNGVDSSTLVEGIRRKGHERVFAIEGEDTLAPIIASLAKPGDLVIGLGAGNITDWARALPARLQACNPLLGAAE